MGFFGDTIPRNVVIALLGLVAVGSVYVVSGARGLQVGDTANDNIIAIKPTSDEGANRVLNIPTLGANRTLAMVDMDQTWSGVQTFEDAILGTTTVGRLVIAAPVPYSLEIVPSASEADDRILNVPTLGGNKTIACIDLAQTFSGQQQFGRAPYTADALGEVVITATANTQKALVLQGASGQNVNLLSVQNNSGAVLSAITKTGSYNTTGYVAATGDGTAAVYLQNAASANIYFYGISNEGQVKWDSAVAGTPDVGLARGSAGLVKVTNGSTGLGTVQVGAAQVATANTASLQLMSISEEVTLGTGATATSSSNLLPASAYIVGVTARVTTVLSESRTWKLGPTGGADDAYAEALQPGAAGTLTSTWSTGHVSPGGPAAQLLPFLNAAANTILITPSAADAEDPTGKIRITVFYYTLTAPGS